MALFSILLFFILIQILNSDVCLNKVNLYLKNHVVLLLKIELKYIKFLSFVKNFFMNVVLNVLSILSSLPAV